MNDWLHCDDCDYEVLKGLVLELALLRNMELKRTFQHGSDCFKLMYWSSTFKEFKFERCCLNEKLVEHLKTHRRKKHENFWLILNENHKVWYLFSTENRVTWVQSFIDFDISFHPCQNNFYKNMREYSYIGCAMFLSNKIFCFY